MTHNESDKPTKPPKKPGKAKRLRRKNKPDNDTEAQQPEMSVAQIMGGAPSKIEPSSSARPRLVYLDAVRGLVIMLMAIDHARDFWSHTAFQPTDLSSTDNNWQWFFTRWITHLCAPVFVLLAGMGAWLWQSRGRSRAQLTRFLLTRGLWLILIEFAVVSIWWQLPFGVLWKGFTPDILYPMSQVTTAQFPPAAYIAQVIWVIGISMVILSGLIWLPLPAIGILAVAVILGHNAIDQFDAEFSPMNIAAERSVGEKLHGVAHTGFGFIPLGGSFPLTTGRIWMNVYPVVPWFAVLALGYAIGPLTKIPDAKRRKVFFLTGLALLAGFVALRFKNIYGNPTDWTMHDTTIMSVMSFVNVEKYPPSAQYLLVMLGIGMVLLATIDLLPKMFVWILTVYGRVPFLFYVLHLPLLWLGTAIMLRMRFGDDGEYWSLFAYNTTESPQLWRTYAAWVGVLVALFPVCYAFGKIKQSSRAWWLSYL